LTGNLTPTQISQLNQQLLTDGVIQQATITTTITPSTKEGHIVDVFFHPGVTDTLAESVLIGAQMIGIDSLEQVETGRRYILDRRLTEDEVHTIAQALLYNPVIQTYIFVPVQPEGEDNLQMADPMLKDERGGDPLQRIGQGPDGGKPHPATIPTAP